MIEAILNDVKKLGKYGAFSAKGLGTRRPRCSYRVPTSRDEIGTSWLRSSV